jgi:hypothetical protein
MDRCQYPIQIDPISSRSSDDPSDDEMRILGAKNFLGFQFIKNRMWKRYFKRRFEVCFVFAESDLLTRGSATNQESNGIDQQGLTGPGLSGQHGKPWVESQTQALDNGKIGDSQLSEHGCDKSC